MTPILYQLPVLRGLNPGSKVFIVEGEKDADRLIALGLTATTNPMGAGKWKESYSAEFADLDVVILPDNDDAGHLHAERVARSLQSKASIVRIVYLNDLPLKGDVSDWLNAGHDGAELCDIAAGTPEWEPTEEKIVPLNPIAARRFPRTDTGNGEYIVHIFGDRIRYDHRRVRWLIWAEHWWREDDTEAVFNLAIQAARARYRQAQELADLEEREAEAKWAISSENRSRIESALKLARTMPPIADCGAGWDANAWTLGVANGVVDLHAGELRAGHQDDKITKHAPVAVDPMARCPIFEEFLERVQPDAEMRAYLQRRAGYALTGDVSEQDLLFYHGQGANGKTTYANALMDTLGRDYSRQAAPGLLLGHAGERHPTEIADLDGARFVISTEVDDGRAFAEGLIKQLTGGDRLKARRMRQDFWEFEATFKVMLLANHKPTIRGTDWAIWRRVKLVPWDVIIPGGERDARLREKLRTEASGILNWMIAGCMDWQRDGMQEPESVAVATQAYRTESDQLAPFIDEKCLLGEHCSVTSADAYKAYQAWAGTQGLTERERLSAIKFGKLMGERFTRARVSGKGNTEYRGVGLLMGLGRCEPFSPSVNLFESNEPETPVERPETAFAEVKPEIGSQRFTGSHCFFCATPLEHSGDFMCEACQAEATDREGGP